jgi:hypothetical protein
MSERKSAPRIALGAQFRTSEKLWPSPDPRSGPGEISPRIGQHAREDPIQWIRRIIPRFSPIENLGQNIYQAHAGVNG